MTRPHFGDTPRVPKGIELEIDARLKRITEPRLAYRQDGENSRQAVEIQKIGSLVLFWGLTGIVANGTTKSLYLGPGGQPQGNPFTRAPIGVLVLFQRSTGLPGARRAAGPMDDLEEWKFGEGGATFQYDLERVAEQSAYRVNVTNGTGSDRDFAVHAWGI